MDIIQAKCAASYASLGYQFQGIVINHEEPLQIGLRNGTCDEWFWVDLKVKHRSKARSFPVFLENNGNLSHSLCYRQENGSTPMGNTTNCKAVQTHAPGGPVKSSNISNGTYWVQGMAWLCGQRAYFILPRNWTGQCAPIFISDHTFKITMDEFKLWTERQKVAHIKIGVVDRISEICLNASCKIDGEQDQEIDALRIAVMQHRVALDMILAEKGGLCVLFNNTCCTYIPDNVHSPNMTDDLKTLRQLRDAQQRDYATNTEDWLTWLLSGSWKSLLIKGLVFVGVIILLLCLFTSGVIPCLKNMVSKMVTASIHTLKLESQLYEGK
uniref:Uncharacterized protein n=1 Tax=Oreochromis niloticus TaxID=8128 RepID=A0A669DZQ1_ORENI